MMLMKSHPNQQSNPNSNPLINLNYPNPNVNQQANPHQHPNPHPVNPQTQVNPHGHANSHPAPTWAGRDSMGNIFILPRQLEVGLCQNCKRLFGGNSQSTSVNSTGQT